MAVCVIGSGTAGVISVCRLLSDTHEEVSVIYDPSIPILGIGESTTSSIPQALYKSAKFSLWKDGDFLDATVKYGVKYKDWRPHDIYSRFPTPIYGIHFNNFYLAEWTFSRLKQVHGDRFTIINATVKDIVEHESHAEVSTDDGNHKYSMVVDCRGWPETYEDYTTAHIPVNSAIAHVKPTPNNFGYTGHTATKDGWMFTIPLTTRTGNGYLFNDKITSKEEALVNMAELLKMPLSKLAEDHRTFEFKNYYAKNFMTRRIVKNGNRALFFEPLEAMSGYFYDDLMTYTVNWITNNSKWTLEECNRNLIRKAQYIEMFINYIYHGGSNHDTQFWRETKEKSSQFLKDNEWFDDLKNVMHNLTLFDRSDNKWYQTFTTQNWYDFDKQFGYNYWSDSKESKEW